MRPSDVDILAILPNKHFNKKNNNFIDIGQSVRKCNDLLLLHMHEVYSHN